MMMKRNIFDGNWTSFKNNYRIPLDKGIEEDDDNPEVKYNPFVPSADTGDKEFEDKE